MPIEILTDIEKLEKWNDICLIKGWAKPGEMQAWFKMNSVRFTPAGSVLAPDGLTLKALTEEMVIKLVANQPGEVMATNLLAVYTGLIHFPSTALETTYWKHLIGRMSSEFDTFMPPELVPKYIRNSLKYPSDGEGELPT